jgi:hypothetical protein
MLNLLSMQSKPTPSKMSLEGLQHLVQCHCILPQYRRRKDPVFHKFTVFSILEDDRAVEKSAQCPNCGILHRVFDICKSEILIGKDETKTLAEIKDLKIVLPASLVELLESYSCEVNIWEQAIFIRNNKKWGEKIKLSSDASEDENSAKFLVFLSPENYRVDTETSMSTIG